MSNFEHLDDPQPPSFDDRRWERVRSRSRALARRRRVAWTTTGAAGAIGLIVVAAGLALVVHNRRGNGLVTIGASSSSAESTAATSTTLDPSVWVTVQLEVDHTSVNQGQDVTGTVVFENHRSGEVALPDPAQPVSWQVVVGSGSSKPLVAWLDSGQRLRLAPGTTRVPFRAITRQSFASCPGSALNCPPLFPAGPASVWFVTDGAVEHVAIPAPVAITITGHGGPLSQPLPCPVPSPQPSMATGQYCGPVPPPGNGLGPNGECTGRETTVPCGPGVVPDHYYAFTLPGRCDGVIVFDGRRWISELPPPTNVPDFDVWMRLDANGDLGFIGPRGAVGFTPDDGRALNACTR